MTHRKTSLQVVREGNPGHHGRDRLDAGLRLPIEPPPEPDWRDWWPGRTGNTRRNGEHTRARRVARATWRRVVDILGQQRLLSTLDADLLADLAIATAQLDEAERRIHRGGTVITGQKGNDVRHPLWPVINQLRTHLRKLWVELGIGPLARDRLPRAGDDDPADDWD